MAGATSGAVTTDGVLDRDFLAEVGTRVRGLRTERSLTVQELADRSRISRRLLTQIELGQANPGLVAVTRIARALGTDFTTLLETGAADTAVEARQAADRVLVWSSEAGSTAYLLVATAQARSADLWLWHLVPGDTYRGQADPARSQELFHVLAGELVLSADEQDAVLRAGASGRLRSDRPYAYRSTGAVAAEFVRVVALAP